LATKIGIDGDERAQPTSACDVEVVASPAINDGALRLLMSGRAPDPIESIMVFALQFSNSISAKAVMDRWSGVLLGFGEHIAEFQPLLPVPAGSEYTTTVRRATIPEIGDRSEAVTGSIDLIDPAGQSGTMPLAGITYQDGTRAYLLIVVSIPTEREPGAAAATPVPSDALLARLTEVAHGFGMRSQGGSVTWSPTLGHCVGGMFDILPAPADMTDAEVIYEQQMVGSTAD
jgi:hypothetical protein